MSAPALLSLRNVKVPVSDLRAAVEWYGRVFGFQTTMEFPDTEGVVRGVHGELPGIGPVLALREDANAARGLGAFAIANFAVSDRAMLQAWVTHLDELGVDHGSIVDTPRLSILVVPNPDGQEIHLYTPIQPGPASTD